MPLLRSNGGDGIKNLQDRERLIDNRSAE